MTNSLSARRAAWCFASAQHAVVAAQRRDDQEPVDVEHVLRRFTELRPDDQRAVAAFIEAYHLLSDVVTRAAPAEPMTEKCNLHPSSDPRCSSPACGGST